MVRQLKFIQNNHCRQFKIKFGDTYLFQKLFKNIKITLTLEVKTLYTACFTISRSTGKLVSSDRQKLHIQTNYKWVSNSASKYAQQPNCSTKNSSNCCQDINSFIQTEKIINTGKNVKLKNSQCVISGC